MRRLIALCLLCLMLAVPLYAQDDTLTPYEIALQRIEAARESGATELDLSYLGLTALPPEIGQLNNLRLLLLNNNQLTVLPPEIGQLVNLNRLSVSNNELTTFPPEISLLNNLHSLDLNSNQLVTFPLEIGLLGNLQWLYIRDNQLVSLPSEIGQLSNLGELDLYNNQLATIPSEIGQLSQLQVLVLSHNQLMTIPSEIGQLSYLCILGLSENNLQNLPTTLGILNSLTHYYPSDAIGCGLYLDENPLISPPPEVVEQGTAAVLAYLRNQAWYHTQRLIVGAAGGVGMFVLLLLGFRWKQRGGRKPKQKRG